MGKIIDFKEAHKNAVEKYRKASGDTQKKFEKITDKFYEWQVQAERIVNAR